MGQNVKKAMIKGSVFVLVFLLAIIIIGNIVNRDNADMTVEMSGATYPVITMNVDGMEVNHLFGYSSSMKEAYMRSTITPISSNRQVSIKVDKYSADIKNLSFEVRSLDGERLIESTAITKYDENEDNIRANITIKDLIEENQEYNFIILVELENNTVLKYYTRIIQAQELYVKEKLNFVNEFHNKIFNKESAKTITKYLESNVEGDNSSYSKVTIHSSFNQITWGDMSVKKEEEPTISIVEMGTETTSVRLDYKVSVKEGKQTHYYKIREYYRVRYSTDRMYLLDYERTMTQYFEPESNVIGNGKIYLGITDEDIILQESGGGNVFAFVYNKQLLSYNVADNKFSVLFSFYNQDNADIRALNDNHEIEILTVDETGNVRFLVYGYMNRGRHEGSVGIQVYSYNSMLNTIEEEVYIPYDKPYDILSIDIKKLSYVSKTNILYLLLDGNIFAVNLASKTYDVIVNNLIEDSYEVSDSNRIIVWQEKSDEYGSRQLKMMNLNTKGIVDIDAPSSQRIKPLGFIGEDLVYGVADISDITSESSGRMIFPMKEVIIQNEMGDILKTYKEHNIFIEECSIENNQITLKRITKQEDGNYGPATEDYIMDNQVVEKGENSVETIVTELYAKVVQLAVKETTYQKNLKILTPKEVLFEGGRHLKIEQKSQTLGRYYVYGQDGASHIYTNPAKAIQKASTMAGVVVNDWGIYVWQPGNRRSKNQIMAIQGEVSTPEKSSLAVCLDTMLAYEGIMRNTQFMLDEKDTTLSILKNNMENAQILDLTGCELDTILYYTNRDIPVLAMLENGESVLIIGYNELNIVIMDPITGTVSKKGMNDSKVWFEENGNRFITYIKK